MVDIYLMTQMSGENLKKTNEKDKAYEEVIDKLADEYATREAESYAASTKLLSKEQAKYRLKMQFKEEVRLEDQQSLLSFAVRCITQDGKLYLKEEDWQLLSNEIKISSEKLAKISYKEEIPERLYIFLGFSDKGMELIDMISREKFKEENYSLAQALGALLTILDSYNPSYWLHFGICYQEGGFYEKAIKAYSICHLLDPDSILAWICCSECYIKTNKQDNAKVEYE
jgi:tetratricopeptide (TPR) repeat protein